MKRLFDDCVVDTNNRGKVAYNENPEGLLKCLHLSLERFANQYTAGCQPARACAAAAGWQPAVHSNHIRSKSTLPDSLARAAWTSNLVMNCITRGNYRRAVS